MERDFFSEDTLEMHELKAAAFETLMFFPGIDYERWCQVLLKEYTEEVIDALGEDPQGVLEDLRLLWDYEYTDPSTDITKKYSEWAKVLKNQAMVDRYRELVLTANKMKGIK